MDKSKVYYLAGAYSDKDSLVMEERFLVLTEIAAKLVKEGYVVFSPISYGHLLVEFEEMPVEFSFWENFCISLLSKCDEMIVLSEGHEQSKGVLAEIEYCKKNDIPYKILSEEEIYKEFKIFPEEDDNDLKLTVKGCDGCPFLQMYTPDKDKPVILNCSLNLLLNGVDNLPFDVEDRNIDPSSDLQSRPDWCPISIAGEIKIN